jgi:uncharacterized membrane protein
MSSSLPIAGSASGTQLNHAKDDKIAIDFIDPLFAVVLHISFIQIYEQPWFWSPRMIWHEPNIFHIATLSLAYLTVILSWIGYHASMKKRWIDVKAGPGKWRFFLDVLLLFSYFILLVSFKCLKRELWMLAFIFLLFFLWDLAKRFEWREQDKQLSDKDRSESIARRGVTVFWFVAFFVLAVFYQFTAPTDAFPCLNWVALVIAILFTILYRVHKTKLWFKDPLLQKLGLP